MSEPEFVPVDLTEMQDEGVLLAANAAFFWPLGLALTWNVDDDGVASGLHIREWTFEDGHHERIDVDQFDELAQERRRRFFEWRERRMATMRE